MPYLNLLNHRPPQQPSKIISQSSPRLITAIGAICRPSPRVSLSSPTALKRQLGKKSHAMDGVHVGMIVSYLPLCLSFLCQNQMQWV